MVSTDSVVLAEADFVTFQLRGLNVIFLRGKTQARTTGLGFLWGSWHIACLFTNCSCAVTTPF